MQSKWVVLIITYVQWSVSSCAYVIPIYATELKNMFNMSQQEYSVASSLYLVTSYLMMSVFGPLCDKYGPRKVSLAGVALAVPPHAILFILCKINSFKHEAYLIMVLLCLASAGFGCLYITSLWSSVNSFERRYHGKVIGSTTGMSWFAAAVLGIIYQKAFQPNLGNFFLMVFILSLVASLLTVTFCEKVPTSPLYESLDYNGSDVSIETKDYIPLQSWWSSPQYCSLFWMFGLITGTSRIHLAWLSSFGDSLGFDSKMLIMLNSFPFVSAVSVLILGVFSDAVLRICPRIYILLFVATTYFAITVASIFFIYRTEVFVLFLIINAVAIGSNDTIIPAEVHEVYGEDTFGKSFGIIYMNSSIMNLSLQFVLSAFYDNELKKETSVGKVCYGAHCFTNWLIFVSVLSGVSAVLGLLYVLHKKSLLKNNT